jgi:anti-sigma regulatory factor (Ser/Thr protein kinase)
MNGPDSAFQLAHSSDSGEVRREAMALATRFGFGSADAGRVGLIVTELATNVVKHAGSGQILLRHSLQDDAGQVVEVLALDRGPGMTDVARCMQDGYSTAGSPGTGLGAVSRLASFMDLYSMPGQGTAVFARVSPDSPKRRHTVSPFSCGGVRVPYPGEPVCGDGWCVRRENRTATVMLADGLGHGPQAAAAADEAMRLFQESGGAPLDEILNRVHRGLLSTRGAAVSIAEVDLESQQVRFTGAGNVAGFIARPLESKSMVAQGGTVGAQIGHPRVFTYPWNSGVLVMHTDGLSSKTRTDTYTGLLAHHPRVIAGVLYRDFTRARDDATVVVLAARKEAD